MSSECQRREHRSSKGSWQTVPDVWAGDRKTLHDSHRPGKLAPMQAFVYHHGELVLDALAANEGHGAPE